jgi:putative transposase
MHWAQSGFHAAEPVASARSRSNEAIGQQVKANFIASDRTYGGRLARSCFEGVDYGLHRTSG